MNTNKYFTFSILFLLFTIQNVFATADWTILIYLQARNNLNRFAAQNLQSISKVGSNKNLNILVQWYQPGQEGTWRYKINKNKIELDTYVPGNSDGSNVKDLVGSMKWAVSKYPAKKYFLILWNHGAGVLDPVWNKKRRGMPNIRNENFTLNLSESDDEENLYIKLDGILGDDFSLTQDFDPSSLINRGILFNEHTRTYLNNQELLEALKQIHNNVLKSKKLDILGMDACLMAMTEIAYQVKDQVKYMVSSQEAELAYGWNYEAIFKNILTGITTPIEMVKGIVLTYEQFYKNRIRFYTQSAINLENIDLVKETINDIVNKTNQCKKYDIKTMKNIIKKSRNSSLQFSTRSYIDLHNFYTQFIKNLNYHKTNNNNFSKAINNLKNSLNLGIKSIRAAIIAKTAGPNLAAAQGLSIYFPKGRIDQSYYKTKFAQETQWLNFIQGIY